MPNVASLPVAAEPDEKAAEALKHLEQAWGYYSPEPLPALPLEELNQPFVPYYSAA